MLNFYGYFKGTRSAFTIALFTSSIIFVSTGIFRHLFEFQRTIDHDYTSLITRKTYIESSLNNPNTKFQIAIENNEALDDLLENHLGIDGYWSGLYRPDGSLISGVGKAGLSPSDFSKTGFFNSNSYNYLVSPIETSLGTYYSVNAFPIQKSTYISKAGIDWNLDLRNYIHHIASVIVFALLVSIISFICIFSILVSRLKHFKVNHLNLIKEDLEEENHELSNLTRSIGAYTDILINNPSREASRQIACILDCLNTHPQKLTHSVNKSTFDIAETVKSMASNCRLELKECNRNVVFNGPKNPIFVEKCFSRIVLSLANIFQNATRHGSGEIQVSVLEGVSDVFINVRNNTNAFKRKGKQIGLSKVKEYCNQNDVMMNIENGKGFYNVAMLVDTSSLHVPSNFNGIFPRS